MERCSFTLFFEDPYWVGIVEKADGEQYMVGRTVFGAEPSNAELLEFVHRELQFVQLLPSAAPFPIPRKAKPARSTEGKTKRSLEVYKAALCGEKAERKAGQREEVKEEKEALYQKKKEKRLKKKLGH
jgi:hypothetical protein